jgi:hypothetical protein
VTPPDIVSGGRGFLNGLQTAARRALGGGPESEIGHRRLCRRCGRGDRAVRIELARISTIRFSASRARRVVPACPPAAGGRLEWLACSCVSSDGSGAPPGRAAGLRLPAASRVQAFSAWRRSSAPMRSRAPRVSFLGFFRAGWQRLGRKRAARFSGAVLDRQRFRYGRSLAAGCRLGHGVPGRVAWVQWSFGGSGGVFSFGGSRAPAEGPGVSGFGGAGGARQVPRGARQLGASISRGIDG